MEENIQISSSVSESCVFRDAVELVPVFQKNLHRFPLETQKHRKDPLGTSGCRLQCLTERVETESEDLRHSGTSIVDPIVVGRLEVQYRLYYVKNLCRQPRGSKD